MISAVVMVMRLWDCVWSALQCCLQGGDMFDTADSVGVYMLGV